MRRETGAPPTSTSLSVKYILEEEPASFCIYKLQLWILFFGDLAFRLLDFPDCDSHMLRLIMELHITNNGSPVSSAPLHVLIQFTPCSNQLDSVCKELPVLALVQPRGYGMAGR